MSPKFFNMNSSMRQSVRKKSTAHDSLISEPISKKVKHKQSQLVKTDNNLTANKQKSALISMLNTRLKDQVPSNPADNKSSDAISTESMKIEKPQILAKTVLYITNNSDDEEIDVENIDVDSVEEVADPSLGTAISHGTNNLSVNEDLESRPNITKSSNITVHNKTATPTANPDTEDDTVLKSKTLFSPSNKTSRTSLIDELKAIENVLDHKAKSKKKKDQSDDVGNKEINSEIYETPAKPTNKNKVDNNKLTSKENESVINVENKQALDETTNFKDLTYLRNVKVVLDKNSVNNYLKNKQIINKKALPSPETSKKSIKYVNKTNDSKINEKVNQKHQRQTTMLNFFTTKTVRDSVANAKTNQDSTDSSATQQKSILNNAVSSNFDLFVTLASKSAKKNIPDFPNSKKPQIPKVPQAWFCNDCDYKAQGKSRIRRHIQNKHAEEECPKCGRQFSRLAYFREHKLVCGLVPHLKCKFCPERFKFREPITTHLKKFHSEKIKEIDLEELINKIVKEGTQFKADALKAAKEGKTIPKTSVLNLSKVECKLDNDRQTQCLTCGKKFRKAKYLKMHQPICELIPHLKCPFCPITGRYDGNMKRHLLKYHEKKFDPTKIHDILREISKKGKAFKAKARRLALEGKEIPIVKRIKAPSMVGKINKYCTKCVKVYELQKGKRAMKNCSNCDALLQSQCTKCKKLFEQYSPAWSHVRLVCEPRRRSIKCNDCNYATFIKSKLIIHIQRKHTEIDPKDFVECPKCGKGFKNQAYMKYHEKVCGKSKDHQCEFCSYKTKYQYQMTKHLRTHSMHSKGKSKTLSENNNNLSMKKKSKTNKYSNIHDTTNIDTNIHMTVQVITPQSIENVTEYAVDTANIRDLATFQCPNCEAVDPSTTTKPIKCNECKAEMRYCCKSCGRTYLKWYYFRQHLPVKCATFHQYQCEHCDRQFTIKDNVRRHIFAEHMTKVDSKGYVKCPNCSSKYKGRQNMLKHKAICGVDSFLKCKLCIVTTKYKANLRKHMRLKHEELEHKEIENYLDKIMQKAKDKMKETKKSSSKTRSTSKTKSSLKALPINKNGIHIISKYMTKEEKMSTLHMILVKCPSCLKSYTLDQKKKNDTSKCCSNCQANYRFHCTQCSKDYASCRALRYHIKKEHLLDVDHQRDLHQCSECRKRFTFFENLKEHWRLCLGAKNLICDHCGFATKRKYSLMIHIRRRHMGIKLTRNHKCDKCGFKFAEEEGLHKHTLQCNGGYKCNECGAKFRTKLDLINHIKSKEINQNVKS